MNAEGAELRGGEEAKAGAAPGTEEGAHRMAVVGKKRVDLVKVAVAQRVLVWLVLGFLIVLAAMIAGESRAIRAGVGGNDGRIAAIVMLVLLTLGVIQAFRVAVATGESVVVAVLAGVVMLGGAVVCAPFGLLLTVCLLVAANVRATRLLKQHNVRVGFLGASKAELHKLIVGACPRCGYDVRAIVTGVCPECGGALVAGA